jgi:hypothetical protein
MNCFQHPTLEAVGTCKHCCKGVCSECAKDTPVGLVCSEPCEGQVRLLEEMVERSRRMVPFAARSHLRNAIVLFAMALIFIGFGTIQERGSSFQLFLVAFGVVMLLSAGFAVFNGRRIAKS